MAEVGCVVKRHPWSSSLLTVVESFSNDGLLTCVMAYYRAALLLQSSLSNFISIPTLLIIQFEV